MPGSELNMWLMRKVCMWEYLSNTEVKLFVCFVISGVLGVFDVLKFLVNLSRIVAYGGH